MRLSRGSAWFAAFPVLVAVAFSVAPKAGTKGAAAQVPADRANANVQAITNVQVVVVRTGALLEGRTVVLSGDRIQSVGPANSESIPPDAVVIDGSGAYLIPGLWDMHGHLRGNGTPPWLTTDWLMPLILAHGVTGVRDMNSDCDSPEQGPVCLDQMKEWQASVEEGKLVGPRIVALSSFLINPPWEYTLSEEEARGFVRAMHGMGVPNLKIYDRLSPEALGWMADEAASLGLGVWGHVPLRITAREASAAGLRSLEHARDFLFDCFPGSSEFRRNATSSTPSVEFMRRMVEEHDAVQCTAVFRDLASHGTWYVPTHVTRRRDAFAGDPTFRSDPRTRYIFPIIQADFLGHMDRVVAADSADNGRTFQDFYRKGLEITGAAHQAGVRILVGSDAPDPYVFPGSAVHDELAELVAAGLSPAEALRAATWNGAEFLGLTQEYGSIEPGKRADLVLLEGNPLEDIQNIRRIRSVIFGGHHIDRNGLDRLLTGAEAASARPLEPGT
jgi:hypothetical protein